MTTDFDVVGRLMTPNGRPAYQSTHTLWVYLLQFGLITYSLTDDDDRQRADNTAIMPAGHDVAIHSFISLRPSIVSVAEEGVRLARAGRSAGWRLTAASSFVFVRHHARGAARVLLTLSCCSID